MIINPVVAGLFYPAEPERLQQNVKQMLVEAAPKNNLPLPKVIIAPHAGYIYSGPIAASAYACLAQIKTQITRVVLLAPAHRYPVQFIATTKAQFYNTPLGQIPIDQVSVTTALKLPYITVTEAAFTQEHALEVHLPFLQTVLKQFTLVPFIVGYADPKQVATLLATLWDSAATLIVISSDLSHYHDYRTAQNLDNKTAQAIRELNPDAIADEQACGAYAIRGLLKIAAQKNLTPQCVDLRNSGDTASDKSAVVGYGAFHFIE